MRLTKKLLPLLAALVLCVAALLAVQLGTLAAETPEFIDENGRYVTVSTCGTEGTVLGTVNGAPACVRASDGALHFCDANFPSTNIRFVIAEHCIDGLYELDWDDRTLYDTANKAKDIKILDCTRGSGNAEYLKGIEYLPALQEIYASAKKVSHVDFSRNPELVYVDIHACYVREIDLSGNPKLEYLNMRGYDSSNMGIREIDVSCCPNLTYLNVGNNSLRELDLCRNPKLESLYIFENGIEELNLSGCTALRIFESQNNDFTALDFSECPNLTEIRLSYDAELASLDLTGCTKLEALHVVGCPLTSLDTSAFPLLKTFSVSRTSITSFDFSQNPKLVFGNSYSVSIGGQEIRGLAVVDGYFDLSTLDGFSLSSVKTVNGTYNFTTQRRSTFGYATEVMVGEDLLLPVPDTTHNCAYYTYLVGNADGTRTAEVSIELNFANRYNTVTFVPDAGLDVHAYTWSDGVGEKMSSTLVKGSDTCSFDVFLQEGFVMGDAGLTFRVETVAGDTKEVSEVSGKFDDLYWIVGNITSPTTVYISGAVSTEGGGVGGGEDDLPPEETTVLTDAASGISVSIPKNSDAAFSEGTVLEVKELPSDALPADAAASLDEEIAEEHRVLALYDLSLLLGGSKVQPGGSVKVTLPIPEDAGEYKKLQVMFVDADGAVAPCKTDVKGSAVTFETDHFSQYAVIGIGEGGGLGAGGVIGIVLASLAVIGGGGFAILWFVVKKKSMAELIGLFKK